MLNSIVEYYAEHESYRCGYCKQPNTNFSHGMWTHALTVTDYQALIDRGWRRSGKYCYKPTMDMTCCPMYTIRCRALEFKGTKSQKKVLKRVNKYLSGQSETGDAGRRMSYSAIESCDEGSGEQFVESTRQPQVININNVVKPSKAQLQENSISESEVDENPAGISTNIVMKAETTSEVPHKEIKKGAGFDPTKAPCKKAKQLRKERTLEKLKAKGVDVTTLNNSKKNKEKQLEEFIGDLPKEFQERLQIKLVRTAPPSPEWLATAAESHSVYVKYQTVIHNDKPEKCTEPKFKDFLVSSPLLEEYGEGSPPCGYGSFHQQYWLDGKLIAVGVIDILPKCVSSVYFFYDPQYMNLTLGTYGALREIEFTRHLNTLSPQLQYYYMGYYIHSCRKMRYKGNFAPSDLLCPETYNWFPLEKCIIKLEVTPYSRLDPDLDNVDENYPRERDLSHIPILTNDVVVPYKIYKKKFLRSRSEQDEIMEYAKLVGATSAQNIILTRL